MGARCQMSYQVIIDSEANNGGIMQVFALLYLKLRFSKEFAKHCKHWKVCCSKLKKKKKAQLLPPDTFQ